VPNTEGQLVLLNATVFGWLPAEKSNYFVDDACTIPAALWRAGVCVFAQCLPLTFGPGAQGQ